MRRLVFYFGGIFIPFMARGACPDGYTAYLGPAGGLVRNANGECSELCGAGITSLNTSTGYKFDLFASKNTSHAIHVKSGDTVCYADLISGASTGTMNLSLDGVTYHANADSGQVCPVTYNLSYSCGDGATGTPPESREMSWGDLYNCPDSAESCRNPGYSFDGWTIDSTALTKGNVYNYKYTTDKTMTAKWTANSYGVPYICNYCAGGTYAATEYENIKYGSNFTTKSAPSCTNPFNQTLQYYAVLDAWGDDTGQRINPGASATWTWPGNIRLKAMWSEPEMVAPDAPVRYTLSYSCGDGATGTPPESHSVGYKLGYYAPYDAGTCRKPGYYLSGWKIDSTSLTKGSLYTYSYAADKTMVAQWSVNSYGAPILCNYCADSTYVSSIYTSGKYDSNFTPTDSPSCTNPYNMKLDSYQVNDVYGDSTGESLTPGTSTKWKWAGNIQLRAKWSGGAQTIPDAPTEYTLSYSCGDGATGTPPESHSVGYKLGYYAPYDAGTCRKPGYYLSGWKIDSTSLTKGSLYTYSYTADKTMVAQWSVNSYGAAYVCNNGTTVSTYLSGKYGSSYTPSTTVCTAADGATFAGWRVLDVLGNDTGDTVASGASFTWNYPHNIRLQAIWE